VTILDYGAGNIASLKSAFEYIGAVVEIAETKNDLDKARTLVIPGVGSFDSASDQLEKRGLKNALLESVKVKKKKTLGICLGMQLFFSSSDEGNGSNQGLGVFEYRVRALTPKENISVPHMGYNRVYIKTSAEGSNPIRSRLLKEIDECYFYFVHSYRAEVNEEMKGCQLVTQYGEEFLSGYEEENIFLTQFHPEKSQTNGLQLLKNFLES